MYLYFQGDAEDITSKDDNAENTETEEIVSLFLIRWTRL